MEIEVSFPLDDGYLRRECPSCERQFKWHHGPTEASPEDAPDPDAYFCPYCGDACTPDQLYTSDQVEFLQQAARGPALQAVSDSLRDAFRGSRNITYKPGRIEQDHPAELSEPSDMVIVVPPCHSYEPFKVDESWSQPLHCLLCGSPFALD